ncbi:MAG: LicD family protein [Lachnospiraceae bacterium]|nr:LicD family protein [Lachnospiraceae bacterium]
MENKNKLLHELTASLLSEFIQICSEHHLRWYMIGGSLIGVLRHEGFIPWDDDIDIGMPRRDYEKFLKIMNSEQRPKGYGICNRTTDPNWHFDITQFYDEETEIEIHLTETPRKAHVWVDLFPLDGLPAAPLPRLLRIKNIMLHRYLIQLANIRSQVDSRRARPWYERAVLAFFRYIPVGRLLNSDRLLDRLTAILKKDDFYTSSWAGNMVGRNREKEAAPRKWFGKPKKGMFEGLEVNIPADSDSLQTQLYGDYMKLPPEEERVGHYIKIIRRRTLPSES